jgi:uncharacterized LabA/DUF88 family protein
MNNPKKYQEIYAFIDSQNLNLGTSKDIYNGVGQKIYTGWKLDFGKFRIYLKDKFRVNQAFLFLGYMPEHKKLYSILKYQGYNIIFKPTIKDPNGKAKGNVDAELVLHSAAIEFPNYQKALVVSSDGDFYCLYDYLEKHNKLATIILPNRKTASTLLNRFISYQYELVRDRAKVEKL